MIISVGSTLGDQGCSPGQAYHAIRPADLSGTDLWVGVSRTLYLFGTHLSFGGFKEVT